MERASALVIRGSDWSESSRIVTLFTREWGKMRALAKGGRRLRSNFEVAFDLLSVCDLVVIRKAQGGLDLITEARLRERFPLLRTNLHAMYAGYYIAELLADGTADYDPHPGLYDAALATLRRLGSPGSTEIHAEHQPAAGQPPNARQPPNAGEGDWLAAVSQFELVWLRETGYSPRLEECATCAGALPDGRIVFSPSAGGFVCGPCAEPLRDRRWMSAAAREALRRLAAGRVELPPSVRGELRPLLGQTVSALLGRRPKMLAYVDGVPSG